MDMDHRMVGVTESPETKDLMAALVKAQSEFKAVRKDCENKFAGFKYPSFSSMTAATYPALHRHGLVMQFGQGWLGGTEVLVGRLRHAATGQWVASTAPLHYPTKKSGEVQADGQGMEIANAYAKKTLLMQLTGAWLEGDEPEVEADQGRKAAEEFTDEVKDSPPKASPKPDSAQLLKKIENRMKVVRTVPGQLAQCFKDAEAMTLAGDLTEEQLISLQRKFGALLPKEATHA